MAKVELRYYTTTPHAPPPRSNADMGRSELESAHVNKVNDASEGYDKVIALFRVYYLSHMIRI